MASATRRVEIGPAGFVKWAADEGGSRRVGLGGFRWGEKLRLVARSPLVQLAARKFCERDSNRCRLCMSVLLRTGARKNPEPAHRAAVRDKTRSHAAGYEPGQRCQEPFSSLVPDTFSSSAPHRSHSGSEERRSTLDPIVSGTCREATNTGLHGPDILGEQERCAEKNLRSKDVGQPLASLRL